MSIEKMIMVNMVGHIHDMEKITKQTVLSKCLQPVSAIHEIDTTDFTLAANEKNLDALIDVCYIKPYVNNNNYTDIVNKINDVKEIHKKRNKFKLKDSELIYDYIELEEKVIEVHNKFKGNYNKLIRLEEERDGINNAIEHLKYISEVDIELKELEDLNNFTFGLYKVYNDNILKLKANYENIPSIVLTVYKTADYHIIITFTPNVLIKETERIFKSINCEKLNLPKEFNGSPKEIITSLIDKKAEVEKEIKRIEKEINEISIKNEKIIGILEKSIELEEKSQIIKEHLAVTNEFFYMCGWVPKSFLNGFKKKLLQIDEKIIIIEKDYDKNSTKVIPPTRMKNNKFIKPFESIVKMYGIPSYNEIDPTSFFAISYLFMFGAMFGDLGQGLIFVLMGYFLKKKMNKINLGGILSRLGISSAIFGLIYGSFFGFEHVIPALIIRPMENITEMLLFAVILGSLLILFGFAFSMINSIKRKDMENGLFSRNGLTGLVFYLAFLAFVITKYLNIVTFSNVVWIIILASLLTIMLLKEPITNMIRHKRPLFSEGKGDYFIEGGFGVVETILSMFSNTLSFIRVGAFALNHVGLFIAFSSLADMVNSGAGSILMYVLGNIIIIGLEGLIVFIQGLRLEYYELFSKYYEGNGSEFSPVRVKNLY